MFNMYEKVSHGYEVVQSCVRHEAVVSPTGQRYSDGNHDKTLYDLRLVPTIGPYMVLSR